MTTPSTARLDKRSDSLLMIADPAEDVRGRKVLDKTGEDIGSIVDLMIDDQEMKIRFLRVGSGGVIGLAETIFLIPVDAVTQVTPDAVHIDQTRDHGAGGPGYDPDLVTNETYWTNIDAYYGYQPSWTPGDVDPTSPWSTLPSPSVKHVAGARGIRVQVSRATSPTSGSFPPLVMPGRHAGVDR